MQTRTFATVMRTLRRDLRLDRRGTTLTGIDSGCGHRLGAIANTLGLAVRFGRAISAREIETVLACS